MPRRPKIGKTRHSGSQTRLDFGRMAGWGDGWGSGYGGGWHSGRAGDGWSIGYGGPVYGAGGYDGGDHGWSKGAGKGGGQRGKGQPPTESDDEAPERNTAQGPALGLPPVPRMDDDLTKLATGYKSFGMEWKWGKTRVCNFAFRCSLVVACDQDRYPRLKVSQLLSEIIDMLIYLLCGLTPGTRPQGLQCSTKRKARMAVRRQHEVKLARGRRRFDEIADNYSNVPELAIRDGY